MDVNVKWARDEVTGQYRPTLYPGEDTKDWDVPQVISADFHRLSSLIESKYSKEYLKVCAFYNKMFPRLRGDGWARASYNAPPFTAMDQEREDTGYGTNYNYLKQIVDQITSRLGTVSFIPKMMSEDQSYEYIAYKDEAERVLRRLIKDDRLNQLSVEAFHNAAVLGYSHVFIDPFNGKLVKANDYEIGLFECQLNRNRIKQMMYRDFSFPVTEVLPYLCKLDEKAQKEMLQSLSGKNAVEFSLYFDCIRHECYATVCGKTLPPIEYPFDTVLMAIFQWDTSFSRQLTSSMFDLLYPIQREINRIAAKKQQLIRNYKGSVPVFNTDADLAMKAISNGTGEALYIDSSRSTTELMTVINPTPLDPQLDAEIQSHKTTMYELAGIQNASFDMENMRSAAAVVALDQTRDSVFQAQLAGLAQFIKELITLYIKFFAQYPEASGEKLRVDWGVINALMKGAYIEMTPVHLNDPLSDENGQGEDGQDYVALAAAKVVLDILNGRITYETLPYYLDPTAVLLDVAVMMIKFEALGLDIPDTVHMFLMSAYIEEVKAGRMTL